MTMMLAGAAARRHQVASIAFRAGAATGGNLTTFTVAIPASAQAGDVAFLCFDYSIISGNTISTGPNLVWTQLGTEQQDATEVGSRIYWRKLVGGDPGTNISITVVTGPAKGNMFILVYSGVDGTNPVAGFAQASEAGTTDLHVTPTVVNNTPNAWRLDFVNDKTATPNTTIWAVPSQTVKRLANYNTVSAGAFTGVVGDSNGPVSANGATQGGIIYDSDLSSAKATMWTVLLAPGGAGAGKPNVGKMIFGMYNNCTTTGSDGWNGSTYPGDTSAHYAEINAAYMDPTRVKVRRSFNGNIPANLAASSGANDAANGITPFMSVKADPTSTTAGTYDATIATLAASMPSGSYLTFIHEPENKFPSTVWVPAFQHFYDTAKAANPNVLIGPAHNGYQWNPASTTTQTPDDWWVGLTHCDFIAGDFYQFDWQVAQSMGTDTYFQRWWNWAKLKGKPLGLTEYGIQTDSTNPTYLNQHPDSQRVTAIGDTLDWLKANGFAFVLYWNGYASDAGATDDSLTPTVSHAAGHPTVLSVWNAKVAAYGSTSTDIRDLV